MRLGYKRIVYYLYHKEANDGRINYGHVKISMGGESTKIDISLSETLDISECNLFITVVRNKQKEKYAVGELLDHKGQLEIKDIFEDILGAFIEKEGTVIASDGEIYHDLDLKKGIEDVEIPNGETNEVIEISKIEKSEQTDQECCVQAAEEKVKSPYEKIFLRCPGMYPFEDDEMEKCVQINLMDFSDFPCQYWNMSSNSFLLQGYYNYRHIILAKKEENIYLGIPGKYHRRDRFMAEMFGFHRFKGIHRRPERLGDFGYWLQMIK